MMADEAGLELETLAGMAYDPLSGLWRMTEHTGVNYIAYFQKSGLVTGELLGLVMLWFEQTLVSQWKMTLPFTSFSFQHKSALA